MNQTTGGRRRIAFYAPLKEPDHPIPSGDRAMARLILRALDLAGYEVAIASNLRSFSREPDDALLAAREAAAAKARVELLSSFTDTGKPDLWLTYHPFYKSPDLLGPSISDVLGIPYVTVEASHAPKRNLDGWRAWQALTENALELGAAHFCLTQRDRLGLSAFLGADAVLIDLPPFLDGAPFRSLKSARHHDGRIELITVAMMRPGDKLESYRFLAQSLAAGASPPDWRLTIIGDGPARADVEAAFAIIDPMQLEWRGALNAEDVRLALSEADLYVWPGFGEAYGMAYLEAQAAGLPVLALDRGGISEVVRGGQTGMLLASDQPAKFAATLCAMMASREELHRMGGLARDFVLGERTLERASTILKAGIEKVLG